MKRYKQIAALGVVLSFACGVYAMELGQKEHMMKKMGSAGDLLSPQIKPSGLRRVSSEMPSPIDPRLDQHWALARLVAKEQRQKTGFKSNLSAQGLHKVVSDPELDSLGSCNSQGSN